MLDIKGTKTEENLKKAFAGESEARNKYTFFAEQARKEGYQQIANIFDETAGNEKEHAEIWYKLLNGGIGTTAENLMLAAQGENYESENMYTDFARTAREEGFDEIAFLFEGVGRIEDIHDKRYRKLAENIEDGTVFKKEGEVSWVCLNCGNVHVGTEAPEICPVCGYPQGYYEQRAENY